MTLSMRLPARWFSDSASSKSTGRLRPAWLALNARWLPRVPYMIVAMVAGGVAGYALNHGLGPENAAIRVLGALPAAAAR